MVFARLRRTRRTEGLRRLVRETRLDSGSFIYPLFVTWGAGIRREIRAMPGCFQVSVDQLGTEVDEIAALGLGGVLLFGLPESKDELASGAYAEDGIVQQAVRAIKHRAPELLVITDVCNCEYTSHGHCGVLNGDDIDNDRTIALLARTAVSHARAGADIVAPSDMMDGRVGAIRAALDAAGYQSTPIMAYSAKYASAFYGPFREAAGAAPRFGDRRSHQLDPANAREALREIATDLDEGADIIIVKPALAYLDIIARARERFDVPMAAYNVSGEYAMVKAAAQRGWIDERRVVLEALTSLARAGASIIISYHAKDAARWLGPRADADDDWAISPVAGTVSAIR